MLPWTTARNINVRLPGLAMCVTALILSSCAADTTEDRRRGQTLVCHDGEKTLSVSNAKSVDHLQHGDLPGPCPDDDN